MTQTMPEALQIFLEQINAMPIVELTPAQLRAVSETLTQQLSLPKIEEVALVQDRQCEVPVRLYHPKPQQTLPLMIYFHGGGHVNGSLETHDALCRRLAVVSHCVVLSVGYRLAPEHPYPAGLEDCIAVFQKRVALLKDVAVNTQHVILAGDSAGGNLALSVCHAMKLQGDQATRSIVMGRVFY